MFLLYGSIQYREQQWDIKEFKIRTVIEVTKKTTVRLLNSDCNNVDVLLSIFS